MIPDAWTTGACLAEPTRDAVPEVLRPGDVTDHGALLGANGARYTTGAFSVSPRQAYAASYYGWRILPIYIYDTSYGDMIGIMRP